MMAAVQTTACASFAMTGRKTQPCCPVSTFVPAKIALQRCAHALSVGSQRKATCSCKALPHKRTRSPTSRDKLRVSPWSGAQRSRPHRRLSLMQAYRMVATFKRPCVLKTVTRFGSSWSGGRSNPMVSREPSTNLLTRALAHTHERTFGLSQPGETGSHTTPLTRQMSHCLRKALE